MHSHAYRLWLAKKINLTIIELNINRLDKQGFGFKTQPQAIC